MKRRALLSMLFAMICTSLLAFTGSSAAGAMPPVCCTYTVTVNRPDYCFPIDVLTSWSTGKVKVTVPQAGSYSFPVPPPCPPSPTFFWVSFDGISTYGLGSHPGITINGCLVNLNVSINAVTGCVEITIT